MDEKLRERQIELIKILEAIDAVLKSREWGMLKELEFDNMEERLERELLSEAKTSVDVNKIYKLQGELAGVKRVDLINLGMKRRNELEGINLKLKQQ